MARPLKDGIIRSEQLRSLPGFHSCVIAHDVAEIRAAETTHLPATAAITNHAVAAGNRQVVEFLHCQARIRQDHVCRAVRVLQHNHLDIIGHRRPSDFRPCPRRILDQPLAEVRILNGTSNYHLIILSCTHAHSPFSLTRRCWEMTKQLHYSSQSARGGSSWWNSRHSGDPGAYCPAD